MDVHEPKRCSFCSGASEERLVLIAGVRGFICNQCVINCMEIVIEHISDATRIIDIDAARTRQR